MREAAMLQNRWCSPRQLTLDDSELLSKAWRVD